jgi:hypothetical protein
MGIFACGAVCLLVTTGLGGYYAFSQGLLSQREVLNAVGLGKGEITIINISDDSINTELFLLESESGGVESVNNERIAPFEISGFGGIQPGMYNLQIESPSGLPIGGICSLTIASGDSFQFVVVPSGIAVSQEGVEAQSADDIDMSTSELCR